MLQCSFRIFIDRSLLFNILKLDRSHKLDINTVELQAYSQQGYKFAVIQRPCSLTKRQTNDDIFEVS